MVPRHGLLPPGRSHSAGVECGDGFRFPLRFEVEYDRAGRVQTLSGTMSRSRPLGGFHGESFHVPDPYWEQGNNTRGKRANEGNFNDTFLFANT